MTVVVLGLGALTTDLQAQRSAPQVVEGDVSSATGVVVAAARVSLTILSPASILDTRTDSAGHFTFQRPGGTGEYILTVSAPGFRSVRRRVSHDSAGRVLHVGVTLTPLLQQLAAVSVVASPPTPQPAFVYELATGVTAAVAAGARATMDPSQARISDALRNNLMVDPEGMLGLPADESPTQLNGLPFHGAELPRSLPVAVTAAVGEYDIAAAGYSGGRVVVDLLPAGEFAVRSGQIVVGQGSGRARAGGRQFAIPGSRMLALDVGGTSRIDSAGVSWGGRASRATTPNTSLLNVDASLLAAAGIAPALAANVRSLAQARGFWRGAPLAATSETSQLSGAIRFDPTVSPRRTNAFVLTGALQWSTPSLTQLFAAPAYASTTRVADMALQHLFRRVDQSGAAWDVRTGLSWMREASGSGSRSNGSTSGATTLVVPARESADSVAVGAPSFLLGTRSPRDAEDHAAAEVVLQHERVLDVAGRRQRKLLLGLRTEWAAVPNASTTAILDAPSVEAWQRGDATRVRISATEPGAGATYRLSAGGSETIRLTPALRLTAGVRGDYQRLMSLGRARGQSHDVLDVSPRLGLTWNFATPTEGPGFVRTNLLTRQLIPPGVLRLGAGMFVSDYAPTQSFQPGGRPFESADLACVLRGGDGGLGDGEAALLTPDYLDRTCRARMADASTESLTSIAALAPTFRPPRSVRATASFLTRWRDLDFSLEGILAVNDRQPSVVDTRIGRTPVFTLADAEARGVFVPPELITPIDGAVGWVRDVGGVLVGPRLSIGSASKSRLGRLVAEISTSNGTTRLPIRLGYTLSSLQSYEGGWDRDAYGSPWHREWAPSVSDRRHQVQLEIGRSLYGVSFSFWLRAASGLPFTPLIEGDVNGDGHTRNDRAVIPILTAVDGQRPDTAAVRTLRDIPDYARHCLEAQRGRPAARASCRGPWSTSSGFYVGFDPGVYFGRSWADVAIVVENPLSALAAVTGVRGLRSLAQGARVDPVLARVQGYSPSESSFVYAYNPNFGRRDESVGVDAGGYRLSVSVSIPLAPSIRSQQLDRWLAGNGVGKGLERVELAARLARNVPNLYAEVLSQADELGLNEPQRTSIDGWRTRLDTELWRIWLRLADDLIQTGAQHSSDETLALVQRAADQAWEASRLSAHQLVGLLSPVQESLLPSNARTLMRAQEPVHFKVFYY